MSFHRYPAPSEGSTSRHSTISVGGTRSRSRRGPSTVHAASLFSLQLWAISELRDVLPPLGERVRAARLLFLGLVATLAVALVLSYPLGAFARCVACVCCSVVGGRMQGYRSLSLSKSLLFNTSTDKELRSALLCSALHAYHIICMNMTSHRQQKGCEDLLLVGVLFESLCMQRSLLVCLSSTAGNLLCFRLRQAYDTCYICRRRFEVDVHKQTKNFKFSILNARSGCFK